LGGIYLIFQAALQAIITIFYALTIKQRDVIYKIRHR
jgi:hypothetical protein